MSAISFTDFDRTWTDPRWKFKRYFQPSNEVLEEFPYDSDDLVIGFKNLLKGLHDRFYHTIIIVCDNSNELKEERFPLAPMFLHNARKSEHHNMV